MLNREDNELLCHVGPGTPMGAFMSSADWLRFDYPCFDSGGQATHPLACQHSMRPYPVTASLLSGSERPRDGLGRNPEAVADVTCALG